MNRKLPALLAAAISLSVFTACASQPGSSSSPGGTQVASAASGDSCELDVKRVCQEIRTAPTVDASTGLTMDSTEVEQNQPRTTNQFVSYQIPNGSMVEVSCEMNAAHHTVVYAHQMPGPALTATDIAYIKNAGYCAH
jgi:hypothetical protein